MEIVELAAEEACAHEEELAQLLLDAHRSNMSLGLRGGLTPEHACEVWRETFSRLHPERAGWTRLGVLPAYSERPDETLAGAAIYFREV